MKFGAFELEGVVDKLAAQHKLTLSTGARHSLITPVLEAQGFGSKVTNDEVSNSLALIIASTAKHIDPLSGNNQQITSVAIAQAIHLNFCNIPPFCSPAVKAEN
jgi:hypothetical protein